MGAVDGPKGQPAVHVAVEAVEAVTDGERDQLKMYQKISNRLKRVGLSVPGVEIRWNNLVVEAKSVPPPGAGSARGPRYHRILDAGSGVLRPGRMVLLLGPPGAGRTTLLKALAGQLLPPPAHCSRPPSTRDGSGAARHGLRMYGSVHYNGMDMYGGEFEVARAATYVGQTESHLAELTVGETLTFAAECMGPSVAKRMYHVLREREAAAGIRADQQDPDLDRLMAMMTTANAPQLMVQLVARMLAIDHVMDTVVGNEMLKGISGGQKRRVTCGEMVVGLSQVMMLDEITNGLDAASALAITRALRNVCHLVNATAMATLLQPSPEVYDCFDDVMIVSHGRIAFFGPREDLLPFFASLSLVPQPGQTAADFAQEVTASPADQIKFRAQTDSNGGGTAAWEGRAWISPRRMKEAWDASPAGQRVLELQAAPPYWHPLQELVLHRERYALSFLSQYLVCLRREAVMFGRQLPFFIAGVVQIVFSAFLVSTTLVNTAKRSLDDANLYISTCFYTIMTVFMGTGFNFGPTYCSRLAVFFKQRDHRFYKPAAWGAAVLTVRLPEVVVLCSLYLIMVYWSMGFVADAGRFFLQLLCMVLLGMFSMSVFTVIGAVTRNPVLTQGLGAVMLMLNTLASGFPIARPSIPGWWIWVYWATPFSWTLRAMTAVELTSSDWGELGKVALKARGLYPDLKWVWANIGYMVGSALLMYGLQVVALSYLGPLRGPRHGPDHLDDEGHGHVPDTDAPPTAEPSRHTLHANGNGHVHGEQPKYDGRRQAVAEAVMEAEAPAADSGGAVVLHVQQRGSKGGAEGRLEFLPVVLAFRDVSYYVPHPAEKGKELRLLRDVSGVFRPATLTCLMGASGAGKTTLMDVLAGRKTGGRAQGLQLVNGQPKRMSTFARLMGYVEQLDVHNPYATVEEALLFSARLRVESSQLATPAAVRAFVRDMMDVVELGPLALRPVGFESASGGLSTEARKRLTIAVELVSNPSIVFMDEPTSGLDARAAGMVMRAVRNTMATGRTVVCTIHQPNREIMDGFDELLLLKPGGRTIYYGQLGARQSTLVAYLSSCVPGVPRYEPHLNPANWMLEVTSPAAEKEMGVDFADVWAASEPAREAQQLIDEHTAAAALALDTGNAKGRKRGGRRANRSNGANGSAANSRNASNTDLVGMADAAAAAEDEATAATGPAAVDVEAGAVSLGRTDTQQQQQEDEAELSHRRQREQEEEEAGAALSRFAQPTWVQLRLLLGRALVSQLRNRNYNFARIVISVCVALALGSLFWDKGRQSDTPLGVMNIMGIMYCSSIFISVVNKLMVMPVVAADRAVFYRERSSGMYRGALMAVVQGASELPFVFVQSVIYFAIVYCMVQFEWDGPKMCWYWLFVWLQLNTFTFLGIACLNLTPDVPIASAASSFCMIMWNLLCGFLVYRKDIPGWWVGGYYVNPIQWTIQGLVSSQLGDQDDKFIAVGDTTMTVAQYVREQFSYRYEWRGWVVLVMLAIIIFFRTAGNIGLLFINFQRR